MRPLSCQTSLSRRKRANATRTVVVGIFVSPRRQLRSTERGVKAAVAPHQVHLHACHRLGDARHEGTQQKESESKNRSVWSGLQIFMQNQRVLYYTAGVFSAGKSRAVLVRNILKPLNKKWDPM